MDLIDRQSAIDAILTELTKRERENLLNIWSTVEVKYFVTGMLEQLPSVQPTQKNESNTLEALDCVSRQDAIDAIDKGLWGKDWDKTLAAAIITCLPSAQPEIIRCKDCKYRFVDGENVRFNVCELNHNKVQSDDWFCADGERRADETDRCG